MKRILLATSLLVVGAVAIASSDIVVTSGSFTGSKNLAGRASIVESKGQRLVRFSWSKKPSPSLEFRLVKQENLKIGPFPTVAEFVKLGSSPTAKPISKDLDVWLYRSVAAVDPKSSNIVAFVNLRSAQEKGR